MDIILGILAAFGLSAGLYMSLTDDSPEFGNGVLFATIGCIMFAVLYTNGVFT